MRLIDRFSTSASGSPRIPIDGDPQSTVNVAAEGGAREQARCESPGAPIIAPEDWAPVRPRNWSHLVLIVEVAVLLLLTSASAAYADTTIVALAKSVDEVLNNIRNWIVGILAGLATVFLSIAFVRRIAGSGDPGEIEKSKTAFKSACWGYGGAALAPLVVEILKGIVGA